MASRLRAVNANEKPAKKINSVSDAAQHGSRMDELVQMRLVISRAIDDKDTSPRDLAALTRRQIEISKELEALQRQRTEEADDDSTVQDETWSEEII